MKIALLAGFLGVFALGACTGGGTVNIPACPADISIVSISAGFTPNNCSIAKGSSLTWTNKDSTTHNATFSSGAAPSNTGNLNQNQTSPSITFANAGEYSYVCTIHTGMSGKITVK